ncbi:iron complex transport system permease protein [Salana multivorans]|uniref:Iron complex transport system permease protein n=1 Tax=Salana multivorans TaxID=120377 RepID=A0A3N2D0X1_9MICO|nr:iron chelate uptake ABC transporter family permease subunit [Salana multivorans]ROR93124.1 iron complex transport system permease protein [Salana multivorans]
MSAIADAVPGDAPTGLVDPGYRSVALRAGGLAGRWRLRALLVCAGLVVAAVTLAAVGLVVGDYPLTLPQVLAALTNDPDAGFARTVVVDWRLPRVLAGLVFGAALGAAGGAFQSLTRNPLASPDVIGFSTGSYTGALLVIIVIGGGYLQVAGGALVGGILTAGVVYLLAWRRGVQGFRLIIVGIAVAAVLASFNTWLMLTANQELALTAAVWGAGSLNGTTWDQAIVGGGLVLVLLAAGAALGPGLRQLELGDDAARATGTRAEPVRLTVMLIAVALTAVVTAAAGPIAFVALSAPQIARRLTRSPGIAVAPAACTGALLLVGADLVAQHALPTALPVGIVTVVAGGAYLVWLIIREVRHRA